MMLFSYDANHNDCYDSDDANQALIHDHERHQWQGDALSRFQDQISSNDQVRELFLGFFHLWWFLRPLRFRIRWCQYHSCYADNNDNA